MNCFLATRKVTNRLRVEGLESRRLLAVSTFALQDVNSTSATYGEMISPEQFNGQTSVYYFAHST